MGKKKGSTGAVEITTQYVVNVTLPPRMCVPSVDVAAHLRYIQGEFCLLARTVIADANTTPAKRLLMVFSRRENAKKCKERAREVLAHYEAGNYGWRPA